MQTVAKVLAFETLADTRIHVDIQLQKRKSCCISFYPHVLGGILLCINNPYTLEILHHYHPEVLCHPRRFSFKEDGLGFPTLRCLHLFIVLCMYFTFGLSAVFLYIRNALFLDIVTLQKVDSFLM